MGYFGPMCQEKKKKKSAIKELDEGVVVNPSRLEADRLDAFDMEKGETDLDSSEGEVDSSRAGKFLLYWMTTTTTSTSTTYSSTSPLASLKCTPAGFTISLCG